MKKAASGLDLLPVFGISLVLAAIALTVGGKITSDMQALSSGNATDGYQTIDWLVMQNATNGLGNMNAQLPLIGTIAVLTVVIGFVLLLRA